MATTQTTKTNGKNGKHAAPPPAAKTAKPTKPPPVGSKQTEIPGAERPKLPPEVEKAASALRSQFLKRRKEQAKEDKLRADLQSLMERHGVQRVELVDDEDDTVEIILDPGKPKVKMRKLGDEEN